MDLLRSINLQLTKGGLRHLFTSRVFLSSQQKY